VNRWLALLLAVIGGAIAAWVATLVFVGAGWGILWIFVFGDDSWPKWVEPLFTVLMMVFAVAAWVKFGRAIWMQLRPQS
jgi:hypothetical protein